jgi:hypothetical protein
MPGLALVVTVLASAPPAGDVAVVSVSRMGLASAEVVAHAEASVQKVLVANEVVPIELAARGISAEDVARCELSKPCLAVLGRLARAKAMVRLEAAVVGKDVALLVQALRTSNASVFAEETFVVAEDELDAKVPGLLAGFAEKVKTVTSAMPPVATADAPARDEASAELAPPPELTPRPPRAEPAATVELVPKAQPRSRVPLYVTGGGAVVLAGAATALFAVGRSAAACLDGPPVNGQPTVCVPRAQVAEVQQRASVGLSTAAVAGAAALGLAVTSVVMWVTDRS